MSKHNEFLNGRFSRFSLALFLGLALAACGGPEQVRETPDDDVGPGAQIGGQDQDGPQYSESELNQRGLLGIKREDRAQFLDPDNPLSTRTVYFEFDSSRIQAQFQEAIQAHARYLAEHPEVTLRLEGHTDERGTREYNVALGERRAESVEKALVLAGAGSGQIKTLSFGEERPAEMGSTEQAYAKNRRVELIYVQ